MFPGSIHLRSSTGDSTTWKLDGMTWKLEMLHRQLARPLAVDLPHQPTSVCECVCFFFLSLRAQLPHSTRQLLGRLALILFSASHIRGTGWLETGGMQNISAPTAGIPPRECSRSQWSLFSHRSPVRQLYETQPVHQPFGLTTCVLFCLRDTFFFLPAHPPTADLYTPPP